MKNIFLDLEIEEKQSIVEALIFAADETLSLKNIAEILNAYYTDNDQAAEKIAVADIDEIVIAINHDLQASNRPFKIVDFAGGLQFAVEKRFGEVVSRLIKSKSKKRLSQAALEALSIIAYRQPISKPLIEEIRGVNSNEVVNSLIEKGFVKVAGRSESIGKPLLYATTDDFLKHFGLRTINDLPPMKEIDDLSEMEHIEPEHEIIINVENPEAFKDLQSSNIAITVEEDNENMQIIHKS